MLFKCDLSESIAWNGRRDILEKAPKKRFQFFSIYNVSRAEFSKNSEQSKIAEVA